MTRKEIVDEVLGTRFDDPGQRPRAERWVNQRYQEVWAAADWPFKFVSPEAFTVDSATPTLPATLLTPRRLFDDQGNPVHELTPEEFWQVYEGSSSTGRPDSWMFHGGVLHLAPTPDQSYPFTLAHYRRLCHRNEQDEVVVGPMSADDDRPLWAEEQYGHDFLVDGAISIGLRRENDPSWDGAESAFTAGLAGMLSELIGSDQGSNRAYGGDWLD